MATKKIEHKASKGHTLTLDELAAFVEDAKRSGATGSELVGARVSFGGKIQQLSVDVQVSPSDLAQPVGGHIEITGSGGTFEPVPWTQEQVDDWNRTGRPPRPGKA